MNPLSRPSSPRPIFPYRLFKAVSFILIFIIAPYQIISNSLDRWREPDLTLAYATLLLQDPRNGHDDAYFNSIRLLNYQLQYDEKTRSQTPIPLLVLVTPEVHRWKRDQLSDEGAIIVPAQKFDSTWILPGDKRWKDVMVKLSVFELEEFDRILFLDADTFLFKPLDGVFQERAAKPRRTLHKARFKHDEGALPDSYVFATLSEGTHVIHDYPPVPMSYFNAGFFLLAPSKELFKYYKSLFGLEDRFDTTYPEQNLLNYAHRQDGNMPWARLWHGWNLVLPNMNDIENGVASVHSKLWTEGEPIKPIPKELQVAWQKKKKEMDVYFATRGNDKL